MSSVLGRVIGPYGSPIGRALRFADRLVDSVVEGGSAGPSRGPTQRLFAQPVFGASPSPSADSESKSAVSPPQRERNAPTRELLTARPEPRRAADLKLPPSLRPAMALSSPERMFGSDEKVTGESKTGGSRKLESRPTQTLLAAGWEPPAAHAAEQKSSTTAAPLWSTLARPTLDPIIAAVESDLGKRPEATPPREETAERRERPLLSLLEGEKSRGPQSAITEEQAHKAAVEASRRLMEAVRAHAAAHGSIDDRISLGDMTLIAFAESNKQMAAASAYTSSAPEPRPVAKALGQQAHPKVKEDQKDLHNKLRAMAKLVIEDLKQVQKLAKERFGAHG